VYNSVADQASVKRDRRRFVRLLVGLGLMSAVLASCSAAGAPTRPPANGLVYAASPTDSPTSDVSASPTDTLGPTPTPGITTEQVSDICVNGNPIVAATKYGGKVHPLVLVNEVVAGWLVDEMGDRYAIDKKWSAGEWANDLQLVLCVGSQGAKNKGACSATYRRESDGATGKVVRYAYYQTIRVLVASTGKTLQSKTLSGSTPKCSAKVSIPATGPAPWKIYGAEVADSAVNAYAVSVSTQK
jgi:hypothetical protein